MVFERGPRGRIHIFNQQQGCYRGRITDCCLLCLGRTVCTATITAAEYRIRNVRSDDEIADETGIEPRLDDASDGSGGEYEPVEVEELSHLSDTEPILLTVRADEDERIRVDFSSDEQLRPEAIRNQAANA